MASRRKTRATERSDEPTLRELEEVAARLSIPVEYQSGEMRGGLCRIGRSWRIIINRDLSLQEKIEILAESLAQVNLDSVYVAPRVRRYIGRMRNERS